MQIVRTINELRNIRKSFTGKVGLVPTMGYLHKGHISLVEAAKKECDHVVVSIYVNPTQFAPTEDLDAYPRNLERDYQLLREAGTDLVWTPDNEVMYPEGYQTWIEVKDITKLLEGRFRPTHFQGVTTIVGKLFNVVQPDRAYFGQKDAQQAAVITRMVKDLNFPIDLKICPIIREADGLAMSSRNVYLNETQRKNAPVLYQSLKLAESLWKNGEKKSSAIKRKMEEMILSGNPDEIQYISITDLETLKDVEVIEKPALVSLAVYFGKTRLIDNIILGN